jgi:hypothetical protein
MGAFDQVTNITVPDDEGDPIGATAFRKRYGWEPHEVVIMRGMFTTGDMEAVGNASMSVDKNKPTFSGGSGRVHLLHRMIVDWTFSAGGRKVPVTLDAIRRLPANYSTPLLEKCDALAQGMTEEEQSDFFGSANGHSEENSNAMSVSLST